MAKLQKVKRNTKKNLSFLPILFESPQNEKNPTIVGFCSCGGRIRTCDLQVMSLASYQLLHSAMFFLKRVQRYNYFFDYANFLRKKRKK